MWMRKSERKREGANVTVCIEDSEWVAGSECVSEFGVNGNSERKREARVWMCVADSELVSECVGGQLEANDGVCVKEC